MHVWIIDGHNVIFAIPRLKRLQTSGDRAAAREELQGHVRRFAERRGARVILVFDGNDAGRSPGTVEEPRLETIYARSSDGEADDRILHEARACRERGDPVTVVTDDVRTLATLLPDGVRHLAVQEFWRRQIEAPGRTPEKRVVGDFSDVEQAMAERAEREAARLRARREREQAERAADERDTARRAATSRDAALPAGAGAGPPPSDEERARQRLRLKKEKGRLRQERRLQARRR